MFSKKTYKHGKGGLDRYGSGLVVIYCYNECSYTRNLSIKLQNCHETL